VKATKKFKPTTFEGYLLADSVIVSSVARVMINHREGVTTKVLSDEGGVSAATANHVLSRMRKDGFVYIARWERTAKNGSAAIYVIGQGVDVASSKPKSSNYIAKQTQDSINKHKEELETKQMIALNKALVPMRNMKQQRVVNLRYLNHIQGIR
jgi:hypothetical protein